MMVYILPFFVPNIGRFLGSATGRTLVTVTAATV